MTASEPVLRCYVCGSPATCIGRYEGHGPVRGGCDEHCAHGNEDGWCYGLDPEEFDDRGVLETAIALQEAEARLADAELRVALWSGAPVEGWERVSAESGGGYRRTVGSRSAHLYFFVDVGAPWFWIGSEPAGWVRERGSDPDPLVCLRAAEAWLSEVPRG